MTHAKHYGLDLEKQNSSFKNPPIVILNQGIELENNNKQQLLDDPRNSSFYLT